MESTPHTAGLNCGKRDPGGGARHVRTQSPEELGGTWTTVVVMSLDDRKQSGRLWERQQFMLTLPRIGRSDSPL